MSRLDLASDRLKTALDGLERALAARGGEAPANNLQSRVAELESERERLLEKVAALEDELAAQSPAWPRMSKAAWTAPSARSAPRCGPDHEISEHADAACKRHGERQGLYPGLRRG